jgi:predicted ferric reductase
VGLVVRPGAWNLRKEKGDHMLWTIAVVLVILWMLGLVSGYTMGSFIHILLVVAIIVVLVRVIQGRKPL